ncbi:imelysin family protein [Thalassolituus sp. LLYu03]|uniref:imelysin family protein n=1 Tax=Thalassolituus sp. LLYu03 TaxID=3421656 RepID=UPI003D284AD2
MKLRYVPLTASLLVLSACDQQAPATSQVKTPVAAEIRYEIPAEEASVFASQLGLSAYTAMSLAAQEAQELDSRLQSFLYHPNPMSLKEAHDAWRNAYSAYLQTLLYSSLPLSDPPDWNKKGIDLKQTMKLLDSWPIEGGYIDHVPGYAFSGIVNDLALELNEESLLAQHGFSDPSYASLGYHPFEFMLWGADGQRSARDFFPQENTAPVVLPAEGGNNTDASGDPEPVASTDGEEAGDSASYEVDIQNHNRRRQYVQLLSDQLQKHLHRLQRRWEPSNGYYATLLQRSQPAQVITATLNATQELLSGELLEKRLQGNSSEFSNTSYADVGSIVLGLRQFYLASSETDTPNGLAAVLPADKREELIGEWDRQLTLVDEAVAQWQQENGSEASRQQCRQRIIELMSVLKHTAGVLNVPLAAE